MNRIATIFLAVTASLFFVGCYNDFDTPAPAKVWTDADFSDSKIISIKELKDIFEEAYPGTSGIGQSLTITDDLVIRGKVISSDQAGNVYKSMYLYDESCQSAIEIKVTSGYYITYAPGRWFISVCRVWCWEITARCSAWVSHRPIPIMRTVTWRIAIPWKSMSSSAN